MKFPKLAAAVAMCSLALTASAKAATVIITYTGIILTGTDVTGVFGTIGQNLSGVSYTSVYNLTEPTPGAIVNNDGISGGTYGGTNYGVPTPVSGNITINGVTRSIGGDYIGIAVQVDGLPSQSAFDLVFHEAQDYTTGTILESSNLVYNVIQSYNNNFTNSSDYWNSLSYTVQDGDDVSGGFQIFTGNVSSGISSINAYGDLRPQTINIAGFSVSSVPENTTWVMMIIGFALVGAASRNRQTTSRVRFDLGHSR